MAALMLLMWKKSFIWSFILILTPRMVKLVCAAIFCLCVNLLVGMQLGFLCPLNKLIGVVCDGASVNVAPNGLRQFSGKCASLDSLFLVSGSPLRIVYSGYLKNITVILCIEILLKSVGSLRKLWSETVFEDNESGKGCRPSRAAGTRSG